MDNVQISRRAPAGVLASNNRRPFAARLLLVTLWLAIVVMSLQPKALAQDCFQQCQRGYLECLSSARGDDFLMAVCDDHFDDCAQGCL